MGVHQQALIETVAMALRCLPLLATLVLLLALDDFVYADGDGFSGRDCIRSSDCLEPISFCDNTKTGTAGRALGSLSLFSTLKEIPGECRPTTWFIGGIVALIITVVSIVLCSCLCCSFCPLSPLGRCLRPNESV